MCFEHQKSKSTTKSEPTTKDKNTKQEKNTKKEKKKDCPGHNMQQIKSKGQSWFCSKSKDPEGCLQNINQSGSNSQCYECFILCINYILANWDVPYFYRCQFCNYHHCGECNDNDSDCDSDSDSDSDGGCEEHHMQKRKPTNSTWFCAKIGVPGGCYTTQCMYMKG